MYLSNINKFLAQYPDLSKAKFGKILAWSNPGFDIYKLEKDFLLTLILAKISIDDKYKNLMWISLVQS
ncbi:hypothetical protein AGMMS50249_4920 [candidate division SR1 bacterium]|nr:hypothetical protein AGMMS50249_4920 [candidate division SR1 bacterium]